MTALEQRLRADRLALEAFCRVNAPHLRFAYGAPDNRRFAVDANFEAPVALGKGYQIVPEHRLLIEIPDNYLARDGAGAFVKSRIRREGAPIFHPNVWLTDGYFCFDSQFIPAKTLADQLWAVTEIMQGRLINHGSPASWAADYYYLQHRDEVLNKIRQVRLRLPQSPPRPITRSLPRVA